MVNERFVGMNWVSGRLSFKGASENIHYKNVTRMKISHIKPSFYRNINFFFL